jgi:dihydrofolate reductase
MENDVNHSRCGGNPELKQQSGKDIHAVGGAMLISSLMNLGLVVDELQLLVNPIILGGGKALLKDVNDRHALKLVQANRLSQVRWA